MKLISAQTPRSETQKAIHDLNKEIAELEAENTASWRLLEIREKQFVLLLHVDELQETIEDEQKSMVEEMQRSINEETTAAFLLALKLLPSPEY